MGLVLDTSVIVAAERKRFDLEAFLDTEAAGVPLFVSAITAAELLHGVHRSDNRHRKRRENFVEDVLADIAVLAFDLGTARTHARLRATLEKGGNGIGPHDLIIAATSVALNHAVATLNEKEFGRVPGLVLANARTYVFGTD